MTLFDLAPFVGLGAVTGLDVVSFPQAMISRPIVAATLAGALAGDAQRGLLIGAVLEMVALGTLPFGASRYPEWGSASVVGGALYGSGDVAATGQLALAVLAALLAAWLSGESMVVARTLNAREVRVARPALETGRRDVVRALQLRGIALDLVRGALVTACALVVLTPAYLALTSLWSGSPGPERAVLAGFTAALGAATVWMLVRGTSGARVFLAVGAVVGLAVVLL
ncbi:MAG TPA: PTS sugar transporter subunit IIC [Gemmatimonadaceae bacterium]|nr:PTS sugar transporter subunit IIC [Gemmatimonadaceae bacterium]